MPRLCCACFTPQQNKLLNSDSTAEDEQGEEWTRFAWYRYGTACGMRPDPTGEFVKYSEAASRLDALQADLEAAEHAKQEWKDAFDGSERALERAEARVSELEAELSEAYARFRNMKGRKEAVKARADSLEKGLRDFGTHRIECAINAEPPRQGPCDCGWDEARSLLEPEKNDSYNR
jgi:DNA repair exonuclease SbcCD ATPase subunit